MKKKNPALARRPDLTLPVEQPGELMTFLLEKLPNKNRNNIKTLLRDKHILVEARVQTQYNYPLQPGQMVVVASQPQRGIGGLGGINILFEDQHLLVINKPAGLLSMASGREKTRTAYRILGDYLKRSDPRNRIFIVHRLDRETSGVMLFAKSEQVQKGLQGTWNAENKERTYVALVERTPELPQDTIRSYLKENKALVVYSTQDAEQGQLAITHYRVIESGYRYALLELTLETGRKNQIRVHMQDIGHPVAGDAKYGAATNPIGRLALHARTLVFAHPVTGEAMRFEVPVPKIFLSVFA